MRAICLFEQSGTFKNEFKKLGINAWDIDIENKFNQTDFIRDLFKDIENAYNDKNTFFDNIRHDDVVLAFFPCIRFSVNSQLLFRCDTPQLKRWNDIQKLEYVIKLHKELNKFYELFAKLIIIAKRKGFKLIIENPYSKEHYLTKYLPVKSTIIDYDRKERGDYMKKPTQYWFINCTPHNNVVNEDINYKEETIHEKDIGTAKRSLISSDYARIFIKEFIL